MEISATSGSPVEFPVMTPISRFKSSDYGTFNPKAGYPIPLESTTPTKRKLPSAPRPRPPRVNIGTTPIPEFARSHDIPLNKISVWCAFCEDPLVCDHIDKEYSFLGQTIWQGLSLV